MSEGLILPDSMASVLKSLTPHFQHDSSVTFRRRAEVILSYLIVFFLNRINGLFAFISKLSVKLF